MPQVVRTANDCIIHSLYLIGELGVGETPDAFMLSTGLELMNAIIDKFSADGIYIPFITKIHSTFVEGQDTYSISDIVSADINTTRIVDLLLANYTVQTIDYPIRIIDRTTYYNLTRLNNFQARPGVVWLDKQAQEDFITFYPAPDQPYPFLIQAKSMINEITSQQVMSISMPPSYYEFMKFALARKFISYYPSGNWSQQAESEYQDLYSTLKNTNDIDLYLRPSVLLTGREPYFWQNILAY